ncbi:MAG: succinate dehydrogenase, hydrophobic membrane anchor protein [Pseudomonadota bacterium]
MSIRTPLARARNHGAAKDGVHHWWLQRLTALALVPLVIWFVISVLGLVGASHDQFVDWASSPLVAALLIALIAATFYHGAIGLQVVYEDYISNHLRRLIADVVTKFILGLLALVSVVAVLRLAVGG